MNMHVFVKPCAQKVCKNKFTHKSSERNWCWLRNTSITFCKGKGPCLQREKVCLSGSWMSVMRQKALWWILGVTALLWPLDTPEAMPDKIPPLAFTWCLKLDTFLFPGVQVSEFHVMSSQTHNFDVGSIHNQDKPERQDYLFSKTKFHLSDDRFLSLSARFYV